MRLKMRRNRMRAHQPLALSAAAAALLMGCGGSSDPAQPQLSAATPATLQSCATLASSLGAVENQIQQIRAMVQYANEHSMGTDRRAMGQDGTSLPWQAK